MTIWGTVMTLCNVTGFRLVYCVLVSKSVWYIENGVHMYRFCYDKMSSDWSTEPLLFDPCLSEVVVVVVLVVVVVVVVIVLVVVAVVVVVVVVFHQYKFTVK